jgi:hypothetical protein
MMTTTADGANAKSDDRDRSEGKVAANEVVAAVGGAK